MKQIRILHVFGSLNMGGAETLIMNLYRNMDRSKVQFDFIVHGNEEGIYEQEIKKLGGKVYHIKKYKVYNHFLYIHEWNKFFSKHNEYKIIHGHMRSTASIYLKLAKKRGLKTICHSHSTSNGKGIKAVIKKILQSSIKKYTDYFFSCSLEAAEWLYGRQIIKSPNLYIIKNCINTSDFIFNEKIRQKVRKELKVEDKLLIGQVGRLVDVKNHMFTLNLFKEYNKNNNNSVLLLVGTGNLRNTIIDKIKEYNIERNVILLENRTDVNKLMQAMDIFLMPSKYEGLPLTLVEAQASSLPCVVSNKVNAGFIINDLIIKLSLEASLDEWLKAIDNHISKKRICRSSEIKNAGFDAKENSKWFEKFYISLLK